ncbi:MAG: polyprenyl synthetase family protein [Candidatus Aminicenantes bacterium]|nr:polyprenyl synthetase family protein [Candidatus Aminicenantes bacterium]
MPDRSSFPEYLAGVKVEVGAFLDQYLAGASRRYGRVNAWGPDAAGRLRVFVRTGKMLRAGMVVAGYSAAGKRPGTAVVRAGAAVELIQAGLLIHDDIIDHDLFRRGGPSLHVQYARQGAKSGAMDPDHFGEGMGICLGDIALFMGFEILAGLPIHPATRAAVLGLWSDDLCRVGLAQMQDLNFSQTFPDTAESEIRRLYINKTGRYTFSAPMRTGAILGGASPRLQARLAKLGETMGLLFQWRDDELGLYGDAKELGKPIGSDIREAKLTLLMRRLFDRTGGKDRKRLVVIFGNPGLNAAMLREVRAIADRSGVQAGLHVEMDRLKTRTGLVIDALSAPLGARLRLRSALDYVVERNK